MIFKYGFKCNRKNNIAHYNEDMMMKLIIAHDVKDEKHECSLGTITLPLSRLLEADDMTLNQRFPLKNSGPGCTVKMKMALRVRAPPAGDAPTLR
ncbi:hypothetical protein F2P81_026384 [Scophthalmus maximus]|uniref:Uncharacterized protein n=1 Tax=Scophthalmus maximus TaxID=52904 RepID=A0A6A4RHN6_SCOMX|nr:hypothetical protein F2P81_026384 [Scophthalmus maximus]